MNDARQLYLATYGRIDTLDYYIMQCQIFYVTWKYWHAAKNHALGLARITAYMYQELISEKEAQDCFGIEKSNNKMKLTFHQFQIQLSKKGLQYDPGFNQYKGDKRMRMNTRKLKAKRVVVAKQKKLQEKEAEAGTDAIATPVMRGNLLTRAEARKRGRPTKEESHPHGLVTPAVSPRPRRIKKSTRYCVGN
jgi:hypothetical protein